MKDHSPPSTAPPGKTSPAPIARQTRAMRRSHFVFAAMLMCATIALAATTSMGSQLFQERNTSPHKGAQATSFSHINVDAPLPLIMGQQSGRVAVKGEVVSKDSALSSNVTPSTTLTDHFVRSFAFATSPGSVTASWNTNAQDGNYLYVIHETSRNVYDKNDPDVYSVEGSGLAISTHTFDVDQIDGDLYLSVYTMNSQGQFDLMENSSIVSES